MASEDSSEGLPQGWNPHFEVLNSGNRVQCYINSGTGQKFYSKADLMRYVKAQNPQLDEPEPEYPPIESPIEGSSDNSSSDNNQMDLVEYTSEHSEWLPQGWTMELKTRKSGTCKCYVEPSTGSKFYSKPQVLRHLKTLKQKSSTSKQKEKSKSIVLGSKPEWLPDGWIVEMRTSSRGKTYKVYVESSSGSKFLAKPEVFRYLETVKNQDSTSEQKEIPMSIVPTIDPIQCMDEQPEWLPHGWIVEIKTKKSGYSRGKKYKVFIDPSTGRKFFTKPEVLQYLKSVKNKSSTSEQKEMPMSIVPTSNVATGNSTSEDLPSGWIKEIKTRTSAGKKHRDPFYTDPVSGYVFRSKRDVHRYLETGDIHACAILPKKRNTEDKSLVTTGKPSSQELPPGWKKKVKVSRTGFAPRKDLYYIDPESGYEFRSKRDVHRYLETGDISSCAISRKKRDLGGKSLPSSATKRQKLEHPVTSPQLLGENKSSDVGIMASPLNTCPMAITVDKSSQRSPGDNDIESKENSNKNWSPTPKAEEFEKNEDKNMRAVVKVEERIPTQKSSRKSKNRKLLSLPRRCSNRLAGFEPDMEINSLSIVQLSYDFDKKKGKIDGSKTRNSLTKSRKELRKSVANSVVIVQALPKPDRPPNGEEAMAGDLNKGIMVQAEPLKEVVVHTSSDANNPVLVEPPGLIQAEPGLETPEPVPGTGEPGLIQAEPGLETPEPVPGEPLNKNQPFLDSHAGESDDKKSESEFQEVEVTKKDDKKSEPEEVSKSNDKKSESEFIPPLGEILSDPCLEFAFKTLTGELPVEITSVDGTVTTPPSDIPVERNLTPEKKEKRSIKEKAPITSKKSKTTKTSLLHEDLETQPKPETAPIVKGCAFKNPAGQSSNTGAQPEQPPVFTFSSYWSNPSLESTFKTLTGSLPPMEDKGYLQKQAEPTGGCYYLQKQPEISQPPKDFRATLPNHGFPSLFQTDVSAHSGSPGQMPVKDNPFLSSGSLTFSSFSGKGGGFSSCKGMGFQPPPPGKKNQPPPLGGGFSGFKGTGFQPSPPKNPPAKKTRGRPRKVTS